MLWTLVACTGGKVNEEVEMAWVSTTGPDHCGEILEDEVWAADLNPHTISCHVNVNGGTVSIGPGTEIRIGLIKSLTIGSDGPGRLIVGATEEEPALFTNAVEGDRFTSIGFESGAEPTGQRISNAIIEEGGRVSYPTVPEIALRVSGVEVLVENLTIRDTESYGFELADGGTFAEGSYGLVSTSNPWAGVADASVAHSIPEEGIDLTGNDVDALVIYGDTIGEAVQWDPIGVPYLNSTGYDISVDGTEATPGVLTLSAGVEIWLAATHTLAVGSYGPGALVVNGTATDPVVVTGPNADGSEYHDGISFWDHTVDSMSVVSSLDVSYGGNNGYYYGNISFDDASPTIVDSWVHDSADCGVWLAGTSGPTLSNLSYSNNPEGDVCSDDD